LDKVKLLEAMSFKR
jgi:hypothetical protein